MSFSRQQAIFPDLPREKQMVDKEGNITAAWDLFFQRLVLALQTNYKPEGIVVPPLSASSIGELGNTQGAIGNIIYDTTNNQFKGIVVVTLDPLVTQTKTFTLT